MFSTVLKDLDLRAVAVAERFNRTHAELLAIVMEVDRANLAQAMGLSSTYDYCRRRLNLSEDVACGFIAVARKAERMPELRDAVEGGLSFSKAKIAAHVITPENQEDLLAKAKASTCAELERETVKISPREAVVEKVRVVAEDRHRLELGLSEEILRKLRRAQDLVCNKAKKAASLEDTLAAVLELYLEKEDPQRKAERARPGKSEPSAKDIPAASRHAVNLRDGNRCQAPGCGRTRWVDIHHIKPRSQGGTHDPENLITLCGFHHRDLHRENHPPRGGYRNGGYPAPFAFKVSPR